MSQSLIQRSTSACLALLFTLALLGSIEGLSRPHETVLQWAQQSSIQA
ncbi:MAG: hypothetical protein JNM33_16235 [Rubrivivax sp.]|nr:hypothetical protein [Rubrivivax sp.]